MVYTSFNQMQQRAKNQGKFVVSAAVAADREVLEAIKYADELDLANAVLVGDKEKIEEIGAEINLDLSRFRIVDEPDPVKATQKACQQVRTGDADCLMKGYINTSDFMRTVLNKEDGLRTGRVLSHLAAFEIPGFDRIIYVTDGGINVSPTLEEKIQILQNAIDYLHRAGYQAPRTAILSANELVNLKQPVTTEAALIKVMAERGSIRGAEIDGPLSFDLAVSKEAAKHKKMNSPVMGEADLLLCPNIEVGNILGKCLIYCSKAIMGGLVLGAMAPIILTSRASSKEAKLASLLMAAVVKQ
ncbi:MAG: bifunctional enoyl-CoA hydratase/phosphate acetyltransferase [Dehalobacterium sp.]